MKMSKDKRDQFLFSTAEQNTEQSFGKGKRDFVIIWITFWVALRWIGSN